MTNVFLKVKIHLRKQISVFSPNTGKYRPEITTYLDTFYAVILIAMFYLPSSTCYNPIGHVNALHSSKLLELRWIYATRHCAKNEVFH